jgi:hypothetical protein
MNRGPVPGSVMVVVVEKSRTKKLSRSGRQSRIHQKNPAFPSTKEFSHVFGASHIWGVGRPSSLEKRHGFGLQDPRRRG